MLIWSADTYKLKLEALGGNVSNIYVEIEKAEEFENFPFKLGDWITITLKKER